MNSLLWLSLIIPLSTAIALLFVRQWPRLQAGLSVVGGAVHLGAGVALLTEVWRSGVVAVQIGNWPAPFGITLVADLFSGLMVALASLMGLLVAGYSLAQLEPDEQRLDYHPLLHLLVMGVCGAFLTGDIFNLYVWLEILLITSFVLLVLGGGKAQLEGAVKYVMLNLLASILFLMAVGLLYGLAGTLNFADLAGRLAGAPPGLVTAVAILFLVAFGIKAGLFPLFFWLPASYHTLPAGTLALFAGLLTKVGIYALMRVFTMLFTYDPTLTQNLLLVIAGLTMVTGVLGAVAQMELRKLLAFHIISQIGYLLMGLALFSVNALAATIFFLAHVILAKSALFLIGGVIYRLYGTYDLKKLGGVYADRPGLAAIFLIAALSLAGLPPFSGFWAKFALVRAGLEQEQYLIVGVSLLVSLLTLFSMTKIWAEVFWKDRPEAAEASPPDLSASPPLLRPTGRAAWVAQLAPIGAMTVLLLALGLLAEPLVGFSLQAAEQLLNPVDYIQAVLGGQPS